MTTHRTRELLVVCLLALGAAWPAAALAAEGCMNDSCHATLLKPENNHAVGDTCELCHAAADQPHPTKGKKTIKLLKSQPDLCYDCHDAFGKKKNVHFPVENADCTGCHNPHASAQPKLLLQPMKELCTACHEDVLKPKHPHGPVATGACTACHDPHESDRKKLVLKDEEELCTGCHQDIKEVLTKSEVHPAIAMGCTSCHNPHGTDRPKLLAKEGPQVCFECHADIEEIVTKSPVQHGALKQKGCVACHSPHASDHKGMLLTSAKDTCLLCHDDVVSGKRKVLHGKDHDGNCAACHNPHGGEFRKLLAGEFPTTSYVPYTDKEFGLCFKCHKRDMLQYADTSFATGFRDGDRNLHFLHVNQKDKGRNCTMCHSLHGSNGPMLIADTVPFGKWDLPLKFEKTESGGSCAPGCHRALAYDRKSARNKVR
jgi:predicted CXXCH cytochrome family protein